MAASGRFLCLGLCLALCLLSGCQAAQLSDRVFQWIRNPENYTTDGVRLTGHVFKTVFMRYVMIQCAFECLREPECRSFNWLPLQECQLSTASHVVAPDNMTQDVRFEYHLRDAFSIDQEALGPCSGSPCGSHGQCMETMSSDLDLQAICICDIGWQGSKCDLPEAAPQWGEWGVWAPCSVSCGLGVTSRRRPCEDVIRNVSIDVRECYGADVDYKSCTQPACPRWGAWGAWGACSTETTCGQGVKVRSRNCTNGGTPGVDRYCLGPANQTSPCLAMACQGLLRLVGGFQPGEGRLEVFSDVTEQWGGVCAAALTPTTATLACRQLGFPGAFQATADLRYGAAGGTPFGLTSLSCGGGERSLLECAHNVWSQAASCPDGTATPAGVMCDVDGSWTLWSAWSACSVTCENGTSTRTRTCAHPPALHAGKPCAGNDLETQPCSLPDCPVDGEWLQWSTWSPCSETCGEGTQFRSRACANPQYGGKECSGQGKDQRGCYDRECPVDGTWKTWEPWGACSKTCGGGERSRSRECVLPKFGGQFCLGDAVETEACSTQECPVDGVWNTWGAWSQCNVTCGGGHQKRMRSCQAPLFGGKACPGAAEESRVCNDFLCPEDGMWMPWSSWSSCTATCGGAATRSRERTCKTSLGSTKQCEGDSRQTESCNHGPCPMDGVWRDWGAWGSCSLTCGGGVRVRRRTCDGPSFGGRPCEGSSQDSELCNVLACPVPGEWRPWAPWSACSVTCGGGIRNRSRECNTTSYGDLTAPCVGADSQSQACHQFQCTPLVRTCSEWGERGLVDSAVVEVDPDGADLLDPVKVYCDMQAQDGVGVTVIGHDNEERIQVVGFEGAGEFSVVLNYNVTYFRHAEAIVDASASCRQFIRWECKASLIHNPNEQGVITTGWRNRTGEIADYFGGATPGSGKCSCGMTGTCADPAQVCNCDKNDNVWREDSGFLTFKQDLPVKEFIAGDTGDQEQEEGYGTIGPLLCSGSSSL